MTIFQAVFGGVLVLVLLAAAWWPVSRHKSLLAEAQRNTAGEATHLRRRAWRQLALGFLLAILGVMLAGALLFLEAPAQDLADQGPVAASEPEHRAFAKLYGWYWVVYLLLMLALVLLAGVDLLAVWQHGRLQMKKLQQERRELIAHETIHLRQRRNRQP